MKSLIIAPHPDDEVLGPGGTLFKRQKKQGNKIYWLIITTLDEKDYSKLVIKKRAEKIKKISKLFKFSKIFQLNYPTAKLDEVPKKELVLNIKKIIDNIKPEELFVPHLSDVHSDHKIVSEAVTTCVKNFRSPYIKRILAYETLSETNFNTIKKNNFFPNHYEDISNFLNLKIKAMKIYKSELKKFPFPRSIKTIKALATLRGSEIGKKAAEGFEVLKQILK